MNFIASNKPNQHDHITLVMVGWLSIVCIFSIAPHYTRLPWAIFLLCTVNIFWRLMIYLKGWSIPGRVFKFLWCFMCFISVVLSYRSWLGIEPVVSILIMTFTLKYFELKSWRDVLTIFYLAYFVLALSFLFSQRMSTTGYVLTTALFNTTLLIYFHHIQTIKYRTVAFKALTIIIQALPIMVVLFVFFPRIQPLWTFFIGQNTAQSGLSDQVSPGDVASLIRNSDLAFRVSFDGDKPAQQALYWRGLVYSYFDGRTWHANKVENKPNSMKWHEHSSAEWEQHLTGTGPWKSYTVILEPTQQKWLYGLDIPVTNSPKVALSKDFTLLSAYPIQSKLQYRARSLINYQLELTLPDEQHHINMQLPKDSNPQTRKIANEWRATSSSELEFLGHVLKYYRENFVYTLQPPLLGEHSIDDFLFSAKKGFCGHFASSLVFLMRAAGIPARLVGGYLGGEMNPHGNYMLIHQFDAHAWAEIWLDGKGWVRVDPTSVVAPDRLNSGIGDALSREQSLLVSNPLSPLNYRHIAWLRSIRLYLDSISYTWNLWVLGYDKQKQLTVLKRLLGKTDYWRITLFLILCVGFILALYGLIYIWRHYQKLVSVENRLYQSFCRKLATLGYHRKAWQPPRTFAAKVIKSKPELKSSVLRVTSAYERLAYRTCAHKQAHVRALKDALKRFNKAAANLEQ